MCGYVVADASHARFGEIISQEEYDSSITLESKGCATVDGEEVFIQQVGSAERAAFKEALKEQLTDIRPLGDHRDLRWRRSLDMTTAVGLMRESKFDDGKLPGPRATREYLTSVAEGPGDLTSYHHHWMRRSGVAEGSSVAHSHRILTETFRLAICVDQLDVSNFLASRTSPGGWRRRRQRSLGILAAPISQGWTWS